MTTSAFRTRALGAVAAVALAACAAGPFADDGERSDAAPSDAKASSTQAASDEPAFGAFGVDLAQRDLNVSPGADFYAYANGTWLANFEIPSDLSRWGSFTKLRVEAEEDVRAIVEDLSAEAPAPDTLEGKVAAAYAAFMDEDRLDGLGADPIKPYVEAIYAIEDRAGLTKEYSSLHGDAPFGVGIIPDPADTTRYIAFVGQSGLGMPDRDYYLDDDEKFARYRDEYRAYVETLFTLTGLDDAPGRAQNVIDLETKLAGVHWTREDSRDIQKIYNPMSPAALAELAPTFDWPTIIGDLGLDEIETFLVAQTTAVAKGGEIFAAAELDAVKDYLAYHTVNAHADNLSSDFDEAQFAFFQRTLRGVEEPRARWKRGVNLVNAGLGEAVGQIYVERHFPPEYKEQMDRLVADLVAAFEVRLSENPWMDDDTRAQALTKLSTFEPRIGYPNKWIDYGPLSLDRETLVENARAIREFQWAEQRRRLGGPVDRDLWPYPPQTVNASYNPLLNQITFPAGILQPPFFDPFADPAVNYAAIGGVIGHEIGHGFDDQGRRFDETGKIRDWWTPAADASFQKLTDALGGQYGGYEPLPGEAINPGLTMGENIGDLGGLQMGYAAYHRYLDACCGGEAPVIDGLTGDQRFFLGWAQVWRSKERVDETRRRLRTDPHSPPKYRVNGVVRNLDAWYEAFDIAPEDPMYLPPEDRVRIW